MAEFVKHNEIYPEIVVPEYDRENMLKPPVIGMALNTATYLKAQTVLITEDDRFVGLIKFHNSIQGDSFRAVGFKHWRELSDRFYKQPFEDLVTLDSQHSIADFAGIVLHGFAGVQEKIRQSRIAHRGDAQKLEYLDALEIVLDGILAWEEKCAAACEEAAAAAAPARRDELLEMARILHKVPRYPAETFREALQSLIFAFQFLPDSIGTADRYLLPAYQRSVESGEITREEAVELLQEVYVKINGNSSYQNAWISHKGGESHFSIGGYLPNGEDGFNDLSRLLVDAMMEVPLYRPQVSLRWTEKTPREVLRYMLDCERHDAYKRIALCSDTPRLKALMNNLGFSYEDALTYTMVGCNEPVMQGARYYGGSPTNAVRCLDRLLHDCKEEVLAAETFDDFYALFVREFSKDVDRFIEIIDGFNRYKTLDIDIMSSLLMEGTVESANSLSTGGCRRSFNGTDLLGLITVIDSLIVIRQFVYDDKIFSMQKMLDMLSANWEGYENERRLIYRTAKFHGNDEPLATEIAQRYTTTIHELFVNRRDQFGYGFLIGNQIGYCSHHAWFGQNMRATPDGRFAGDPVSFGFGQSGGRDRSGIAALLNSVAQMDPTHIVSGPSVLNVMVDEALIRDDEKFERTVDLIEAYFRSGGPHIQLNYVSREELEAARREPEKHENLRVRVSGFSGYFTLLADDIQQEIINRTQKEG